MSNRRLNTHESQPVVSYKIPVRRFKRNRRVAKEVLHWSERLLLAVGLACVVFFVWVRISATVMYHAGLWSFSQLKAEPQVVKYDERRDSPDFSSWARKRVAAYRKILATRMDPPLAVLSIPRMHFDVPIYEGTDELTLDRGAGRIAGTARLGDLGNIGIAGHRDGFFRSLKDIRRGDRIELDGLRHQSIYTVDNITVVNPSNTTVLKPRDRPTLTLVTCYPFHFIGDAPQRYVVQASLTESELGNPEDDDKSQN